jgi:DNA-binding NarL/FixJ family response regulator
MQQAVRDTLIAFMVAMAQTRLEPHGRLGCQPSVAREGEAPQPPPADQRTNALPTLRAGRYLGVISLIVDWGVLNDFRQSAKCLARRFRPDRSASRRAESVKPRTSAGVGSKCHLKSVVVEIGEADNVKILVVDDHVLTRMALRDVLKKVTGDATVLEASSCSQAMQVIAEHPDLKLILLDLNLPDRDGFSVLTELGERNPPIPVVVLSAQQDRDSVNRALDLGAQGFITKSGQFEVMVKALELVLAGGVYIPPEIRAPAANRPSVSPADLGLTERQVQVLSLMMKAKSNKAICRVLKLAEPTVKNHVTAILKALKVSNRMEALLAVRELGWKLPPVSES